MEPDGENWPEVIIGAFGAKFPSHGSPCLAVAKEDPERLLTVALSPPFEVTVAGVFTTVTGGPSCNQLMRSFPSNADRDLTTTTPALAGAATTASIANARIPACFLCILI